MCGWWQRGCGEYFTVWSPHLYMVKLLMAVGALLWHTAGTVTALTREHLNGACEFDCQFRHGARLHRVLYYPPPRPNDVEFMERG